MRNQLKVRNTHVLLVAIINVTGFVFAQGNSQDIFPLINRHFNTSVQEQMNNAAVWQGMNLDYSVKWDEITLTPYNMYGEGITINGNINENNSFQKCYPVINSLNPVFGINQNDFFEVGALKIGSVWYISFNQKYNDLPIYTGNLKFTINSSGTVFHIVSSIYPDIDISTNPGIDANSAIDMAKAIIQYNSETDTVLDFSLFVLPLRNSTTIDYKLAWKVHLDLRSSYEIWSIFVDAQNGDILHGYNEVSHMVPPARGFVYGYVYDDHPNATYSNKNPDSQEMQFEKVYIDNIGYDYTNSNGYYSIDVPSYGSYTVESSLEGSVAFSVDGRGAGLISHSGTALPGINHNWTWNNTSSNPVDDPQVNAYYHVIKMYKYLKEDYRFEYFDLMDYFEGRPPPHDRLKITLAGDVCGSGAGLSSISLTKGGPNCYDAALDADIIYHEFNHVMARNIRDSLGASSQAGWVWDGTADYWAATNNNDSEVGEWYFSRNPNDDLVPRDMDNTLTKEDSTYSYADAQITGGALWNMRSKIGKDNADPIYFKSIFGTPSSAEDLLDEILIASDLYFGGEGIVTIATPYIDDILYSFGSKLFYPFQAAAMPPAAPSNLTLTNSSGNPRLDWVTNNEPDLDECNIYRTLNGPNSVYSLIATVDYPTTTYTDNTVLMGNKFNPTVLYYVTSVDESLNESNLSNVVMTWYIPSKTVAGQSELPEKFVLHPLFPNPMNPTTSISYGLPNDSYVNIDIFDMMGHKVKTLVSNIESAGYKNIIWDGLNENGTSVSSGIYICTFYAQNIENNEIFTKNIKLTVLK